MSQYRPRTALILGGIRSGKSEFAESLVDDVEIVRYIAAGRDPDRDAGNGPRDEDWAGRIARHRDRRPSDWITEELGGPDELARLISAAKPDDTLLIDDVGNWIAALLSADTSDAIATLAGAVAGSAARIVIVSPEAGLSVVPATQAGRLFADANGAANQALAAVCDGVALVMAGQATWLKAERPAAARVTGTEEIPVPAATTGSVAFEATTPAAYITEEAAETPVRVGMDLPQQDSATATEAMNRLGRLPVPGSGLGTLAPFVGFLAGASGAGLPQPLRQVRVIAINAVHEGAIATGDSEAAWADRIAATRAGTGPIAQLAAGTGIETVTVELVDAGRAGPIETGDAITPEQVAACLTRGWNIAQAAADRGDELVVLAAGGPGVDAAASATVTAITRGEIAGQLGRVHTGTGTIDDNAWMVRCVAIRDALLRIKPRMADGPHMLGAVGGPAIAVATGLFLGAAQRRTPLLFDGPVGAAAAVAARDYAIEVRLWCQLADDGGHPAVVTAADLLGLTPLVSLRTGLGEGGTALTILPLLRAAVMLSGLSGSSDSSSSPGLDG